MTIDRIVAVSVAVLVACSIPVAVKAAIAKEMELDAAIREAVKRGAPGEHHRALEPFVGRFSTSKGSAEHSWALGGRFLRMDVRGDMGGRPFEGLGYLALCGKRNV